MFTSRRFAPPRTCSSATSSAAWKSPPSTSRRKRAEPVMFVRSPISVKFESARISNGSRPLKRVPGRRSGTLRGATPSTAAAIWRTCSGVVPQQPPTMLTRPSRANSPRKRLVSSGCSSCSPSAFGRPAFGWHATQVGASCGEILDVRPHLGGAERAVDADDERLRVLDRDPERLDGLAREVAAALVDGGEREPERQVGRGVLRGDDRGLRVQRVEDRLDQEQVDAALAQRPHLLGVRLRDLVEGGRAVRGVVHPRGQRERDVERADRAGDEAVELVGDLAARAALPRATSRRRRPASA